MGQACTNGRVPGPNRNDEHPVVAAIAVLAIVLAILLIASARLALNGTDDVDTEVDAAVTATRFATGFSP